MKRVKGNTVLLILLAGLTSAPQLSAQNDPPAKPAAPMNVSAMQVEMTQPGQISLPAEFQVALYENLIEELRKSGGIPHVYRDGDHNAVNASNLVILHTTITAFKKGSEMARQVTTVTGATSIAVNCQFTDKAGKILLERDVEGKVRFFGNNLKATDDVAKKAATLANKHFSSDNKDSADKNVI